MADFIESEAEESEVFVWFTFRKNNLFHVFFRAVFPQEEEDLEPHERKKAKRAKAVDSSEEEEGNLFTRLVCFVCFIYILFE